MEEELIINTEVKGADKAEKDLKDLAKATNEAEDATEDYEGSLANAGGEVEIFGTSLNGIIGGFKSSVSAIGGSIKSLKSFKVALASTGIGLLVIALGSLIAYLQDSQEGMDILNKAMAGVEAVISVLVGTLAKLGGALVKVFQGDFAGAADDASAAITGFADNVLQAVAASNKLQDALNLIQKLTANSTVLIAANNNELAKNKRVIEDTTKATQTRINAAERNLELIIANTDAAAELAELEFQAATDRINESKRQSGRAEATLDEQIELATLAAASIEARTAGEEQQIEFEVKLNELRTVRLEELELIRIAEEATGAEVVKAGLANITVMGEQGVAHDDLTAKILANQAKASEDKRLKDEEDAANAILYAETEAAMTLELLGVVASAAGQNSVLGKAAAIAETLINTQVGISAALKLPTITQKLLGISIATVTGLSALNIIKSTPLPQVQVVNTPFGDGGLISGATHGNGGVWINTEGGEAIINKRSTKMFKPLLSQINMAGGGVPMFADGGITPNSIASPFINIERALAASRTVLVLDDLRAAENGSRATSITTTL